MDCISEGMDFIDTTLQIDVLSIICVTVSRRIISLTPN
jgi:hypothetical protein